MAARSRRLSEPAPARAENIATGITVTKLAAAEWCVTRPKANSAGTCAQAISVSARCRLAQISGGSVCPRGKRSRQREGQVSLVADAFIPLDIGCRRSYLIARLQITWQ
jgi:hypothetical protein